MKLLENNENFIYGKELLGGRGKEFNVLVGVGRYFALEFRLTSNWQAGCIRILPTDKLFLFYWESFKERKRLFYKFLDKLKEEE